jgi:hypothetical protein
MAFVEGVVPVGVVEIEPDFLGLAGVEEGSRLIRGEGLYT